MDLFDDPRGFRKKKSLGSRLMQNASKIVFLLFVLTAIALYVTNARRREHQQAQTLMQDKLQRSKAEEQRLRQLVKEKDTMLTQKSRELQEVSRKTQNLHRDVSSTPTEVRQLRDDLQAEKDRAAELDQLIIVERNRVQDLSNKIGALQAELTRLKTANIGNAIPAVQQQIPIQQQQQQILEPQQQAVPQAVPQAVTQQQQAVPQAVPQAVTQQQAVPADIATQQQQQAHGKHHHAGHHGGKAHHHRAEIKPHKLSMLEEHLGEARHAAVADDYEFDYTEDGDHEHHQQTE